MDPDIANADTVSPFAPVGSPFAPANGLTSRREMFCRHYVACGNAADAARQAGYAEDSARQQGHRLLDDETIKARIEELWHHAETAHSADRDLLMDKTERLFEASMASKSFNAAAQALRLQVHLAGFLGPARQREEVVPGRPGPVMRAERRKSEVRDRVAAAAGEGAHREESEAGAGKCGQRPNAGPPATGPHPHPSPPRGEGSSSEIDGVSEPPPPKTEAKATRFPSPLGGEGPGVRACPSPRAPICEAPPRAPVADPWAEATRIARQRELAGVHSKLAAVRRRQGLASRAALAAQEAEAAEEAA